MKIDNPSRPEYAPPPRKHHFDEGRIRKAHAEYLAEKEFLKKNANKYGYLVVARTALALALILIVGCKTTTGPEASPDKCDTILHCRDGLPTGAPQ